MSKKCLFASVFCFLWFVEQGVMYAQQLPTPVAPPPIVVVQQPAVVVQTTSEKIACLKTEIADLQKQAETKKADQQKLEAELMQKKTAKEAADKAAKDPALQQKVTDAVTAAETAYNEKKPYSEFRLLEKAVKEAENEQETKEKEAGEAAKAVTAAETALTKVKEEVAKLEQSIRDKNARLPDLENILVEEQKHSDVLKAIAGIKAEVDSVKKSVEAGTTTVTNRIGDAEKHTETQVSTVATAVNSAVTKIQTKVDDSSKVVAMTVNTGIADVRKDIGAVDLKIVDVKKDVGAVGLQVEGVGKSVLTLHTEVAASKEIAKAFSDELQTAINDLKGHKFSEAQDPEPSDDLTAKVEELENKVKPQPGLASVPAPPVEKIISSTPVAAPQTVTYSQPMQSSCQTYWMNGQQYSTCNRQAAQQPMVYTRRAPVQGWNGYR